MHDLHDAGVACMCATAGVLRQTGSEYQVEGSGLRGFFSAASTVAFAEKSML